MEKNKIEENYQKCQGICIKLAYKYSLKSSFEYEDLISDSREVFMKAYNSFNPEKGSKFSSWFFMYLNGYYKNKIRLIKKIDLNTTKTIDTIIDGGKKILENDNSNSSFFIPIDKKNIEKDLLKKDCFEKLSMEAKEIIEIILNGPKEVIESIISPITSVFQKRKVEIFTRKKFGIKKGNQTLNEIKNFVKTF